jgi:phosphoglycerate kinase
MELSGIRYLKDLQLVGKTAFIRVDFNVPLDGSRITDDARIRAALPTIQFVRQAGGKVVLASHLGRPKGGREEKYSLLPVADHLAGLLGIDVVFAEDCVGDGVQKVIHDLPAGGVLLLENLRFHAAEEEADPIFAAHLAALADVYINDAFGTAHRAHASTYTMVQHFPDTARAAGLLVEKELTALGPLLQAPAKPYVAIMGGAKVSDKIKIIENLLGKVDTLLIGGAMAYTFLKAQGHSIGSSLVEKDKLDLARQLLKSAESRKTRVVLPEDHIVSDSIQGTGSACSTVSIPDGMAGFDIGPETIKSFRSFIERASTIIWNGPVGVFEKEAFNRGTFAVANAVADCKAMVVVGGGDSAAALAASGRVADVTHVSTGGGASLEFLEGADLPGIAALRAGHRFE